MKKQQQNQISMFDLMPNSVDSKRKEPVEQTSVTEESQGTSENNAK